MAPRVGFVTGAGSGMGQAAAWRLAGDGSRVAAFDLSVDGLATTTERYPDAIVPLVCDVTDPNAVGHALKEVEADLGPVDRVMTAAGLARVGDVLHLGPGTADLLMRVNFGGTVNVVDATLPGMLSRGRGEVVTFASLAGWVPTPRMTMYAASKFALVGYTEGLRNEYRGRGVKFTCVCPPAVASPMLEDFFPAEHRRRARPVTPDRVIDEIERALIRDQLWALPGPNAKLLWRARRHAPRLTALALNSRWLDIAHRTSPSPVD